jgi:hypothetical protein
MWQSPTFYNERINGIFELARRIQNLVSICRLPFTFHHSSTLHPHPLFCPLSINIMKLTTSCVRGSTVTGSPIVATATGIGTLVGVSRDTPGGDDITVAIIPDTIAAVHPRLPRPSAAFTSVVVACPGIEIS